MAQIICKILFFSNHSIEIKFKTQIYVFKCGKLSPKQHVEFSLEYKMVGLIPYEQHTVMYAFNL